MEELENKVKELESKLEKARAMYKEQKTELENANARIIELESSNNGEGITEDVAGYKEEISSLQNKVKDLEDEIAINGSSSEEIKTLNARLEKAKTVFADQKTKIKELTEENSALKESNSNLTNDLSSSNSKNEELSRIIEEVAKLVTMAK